MASSRQLAASGLAGGFIAILMSVIPAGTASAGLASTANPAPDQGSTSTRAPEITLADLTARFTELGIAPDVQASLIASIKAGKLPDSDSGAIPVSTATSAVGANTITRLTFADGSVAIASTPGASTKAGAGSVALGIESCSNVTGGAMTYEYNCTIKYSAATWTGSYKLPWISWGRDGTSIGGNPYNLVQGGIGISGKEVTISSRGGSGSATANARMNMNQNISIFGMGVNRDVGFDLVISMYGGPRVYSYGG